MSLKGKGLVPGLFKKILAILRVIYREVLNKAFLSFDQK
jgi:hypothetical protein